MNIPKLGGHVNFGLGKIRKNDSEIVINIAMYQVTFRGESVTLTGALSMVSMIYLMYYSLLNKLAQKSMKVNNGMYKNKVSSEAE